MPAAGRALRYLRSMDKRYARLLTVSVGVRSAVAAERLVTSGPCPGDRTVPIVSVPDMKRLLRLGGCTPEDGYACLISACPVCKASKKKDIGSLYVNKITGFYCCSGCRGRGQWEALERLLSSGAQRSSRQHITSDSLSESEGERQPYLPWTEAERDSQSLADSSAEEVLQRFNLPVFPEAGKVLQGVRVSGDSLLFPLRDLSGEVSGIRVLSHSHPDEPCVECSRGVGLLQLGIGTGGRGTATLVPSVGDAIALLAARVTGSAVCLPDGFSRLPQEVLPQLEKFSRLTMWGSPDCMEEARSMTRKLGEKRCLLVRSMEGPLAALRRGEELRSLVATARPVWHKAITSFSALREDVLADLRNIDKVQGVKWKRFPALTRLLRGHRRGELTVLTGPTGCGKTTFCSEYSLDLALQGVNTLWGSFEIRNSRLARTMLQQVAGIPLDENIHLFDKFADEFEKLPIHFLAFHGQQSIKDVMEVVEHAFYVHDIAHVIVDNVQFMLGMGDEPSRSMDRYWRQDAVIAAFRGFATRNNCHVTLVMHPRKERDVEELSTSSIFGSAKASQEADSVLIIQDKRLTSVRGKKYLQVAKNRYSGDLGIVPLDFDKAGLSYAQKKKQPKEADDNKQSLNEDTVRFHLPM